MKAVQSRVGATTDVIGSIRGVKMTGLTDKVSEQIQDLRIFELDESKRFRMAQITNIILGMSSRSVCF
jgi:ATP-binding cassette subfamily C (CFTR/MRP) protein 1